MTAKMLIESDPHQTRIAILEDDRLTEIFVERHRHRGLVGNVYKGRVTRVLPGMQAAFVDVGLERDAFLYVSDVAGDVEAMEELEIEEPRSDEPPASHPPAPSIDELLKPGQEIIVQVVKDPLPNKGARISTHVTLPGRYLVLLPTVRHFGVSRRIEDETERERLLALISQLAGGSSGLIVRTVGEGKGPEEFESDFGYLSRLWEKTRHRAGRVAAPTLLHQDLDLALRVVRDMLRPDFSVLWVDGEETYERIVEFLDQVQPSLVGKVKLFRQGATLFEQFGIEEQIEAALKSKVWLKSGGYIVINQTEALVAIDVNTGKFVGRGGNRLEDTITKTNLEAVEAVLARIDALGVRERVLGVVAGDHPSLAPDELNVLYNACDVGLNTSEGEGFGLIALEHAAAGAAQVVPRHSACASCRQRASVSPRARRASSSAQVSSRPSNATAGAPGRRSPVPDVTTVDVTCTGPSRRTGRPIAFRG